ncbi:MAG TPA: Fic family protein [Candidatus Nanoarchaeia archaeon]|nr:Fic family protein [Candidatus Nanoarchaeia archaeon]
MVYTEIKEKNNKKYYYRTISIRKNNKITKKRRYMGKDLKKEELKLAEKEADKKMQLLNTLLTKEDLEFLKKIKEKYSQEPKETLENRYEAFISNFTYNSTAIEGNTINLQETAQLLFENITPRKTLREINEIVNHKKAFDFSLSYKEDINKEFILELHKLVVINTLKPELETQIGKFRKLQVFIRGTNWLPPQPEIVPKEIGALLKWYTKNKDELHPLVTAAYFHAGFEIIHPFVDGNGRVGRLLMNFILHKNKFSMISISNSTKYEYYKSLEEAQKGNLKLFIEYLIKNFKENKLFF